jgi:hypothetical protein
MHKLFGVHAGAIEEGPRQPRKLFFWRRFDIASESICRIFKHLETIYLDDARVFDVEFMRASMSVKKRVCVKVPI